MTRLTENRPADASARRRDGDRADRAHERERLACREHAARYHGGLSPREATGPDVPDAPVEAVQRLPARSAAPHYREAALFYDPPYVTGRGEAIQALSDRLGQQLVRHLEPTCGLHGERVALTPRNCFRLDFLIETGDDASDVTRAGLLLGERPEVEGAPALYDALVVGSGAVDVLVRFDPEGLEAHLADALFLMSERAPTLFERPERLRAETSQGPWTGALQGPEVRISYPPGPVEVQPGKLPERPSAPPDLVMRCLRADAPGAWAEDYRRALHHFDVPEPQHRPPEAPARRAAA
jgi:hypothetical protein